MKERLFLERGEEDDYDASARAARVFLETVEGLGSRGLTYLEKLVGEGKIDEQTYAACRRAFGESDMNIGLNQRERMAAWHEKVQEQDLLLNETPSPLFLRINGNDAAFERYEKNTLFCRRVKDLFEQQQLGRVASTARAATILDAYKEAGKEGAVTKMSTERALRVGVHLSEKERRYADPAVPLPTIGIELEIPDQFFTAEHLEILRALDVPCYRDTDNRNEVNPDFSYSPWVQARILQDLAELGMLPLESVNKRLAAPKDLLLPLHINFGSPLEVSQFEGDFQDGLSAVSDILVLAFSSQRRVQKKGYGSAYFYKDDAKASSKTALKDRLFRLELRAAELSGSSTYRLLAEAQCIVGMFFAYQKERSAYNLTEQEAGLAKIWPDFFQAIQDIRNTFQLGVDMPSFENEELAQKMENPLVRETARLLVARYARKVHQIVFPHEISS